MQQRIAFFDFDGTITTKDTLLEFIKYYKGAARFYLGFLLNSPWLVAYKLKIISNQAGKERILTWFFGNTPQDKFQSRCDSFAAEIIPTLLRSKATQEIALLQQKGFTVVIVSASPEDWLRPWTEKIGVALLASRLETKNNKLTGKLVGRNCYGQEKVSRIKENYELSGYSDIQAYGDTSGDKPMLGLATVSFYKPFR
jgi:HAD superfamily hydrolase (TIGR01490 family)